MNKLTSKYWLVMALLSNGCILELVPYKGAVEDAHTPGTGDTSSPPPEDSGLTDTGESPDTGEDSDTAESADTGEDSDTAESADTGEGSDTAESTDTGGPANSDS